ncbi:hypothetical protein RTBOTA2_003285 [Rhodotorula toruloides]|uniref:Proteophosphoglycan ppg4 n=1 Tax=Rhodotorula toruloides TaxID=5286 RepID=A0A2T0ABH6_RHOTO|nr:hypothetical protein RTBOTA2_003285 [Rhodotorula toruloides]PRQ75352.1 Proteophosphoglycan ppg4 [Rhodotorula toruloides]
MPATLPLELVLQVVEIARFRRLDESAVEHLRRLTRLALACKAFHGLVKRTLEGTVHFWRESLAMADVWIRMSEAARQGRPVETLVAGKIEYSMGRALPESSTSLKKILLAGPTRVPLSACDVAGHLYPALSSLSLGIRLYMPSPPSPPTPLALTELFLTSPDEKVIRNFCNPSATPFLRHLCLLKLDFLSTSSPSVFRDVELFRRLTALEISYRRTPPAHAAAVFAPNFPVPTLLRTSLTVIADFTCPDESVDSGVAYLQLQNVTRFSRNTRCLDHETDFHWAVATFSRLVHRIERGLRARAIFLPDNLHPNVTPACDFGLGGARDLFFKSLAQHGAPYIGWYRADEESDVSPSLPFRRYLDRERLEGRM